MSNKISFLVAAHRAESYLPYLVRGLLHQADEGFPIEIVISQDCETDYKAILPVDTRIIYSDSGLSSGPAVARTRALKAATGSHIMLMDADDSISPTYLRSLYRGLSTHKAVAVRSMYFKDNESVKYYSGSSVDLNKFISFYGSMHSAMPRDWLTHYPDVVEEDTLAFLVALHKMNGRLEVVQGCYHIRLHEKSFSARMGSTFTEKYQIVLDNADQIANDLGLPNMAGEIEILFESRKRMSKEYDIYLGAGGKSSYHEFVQKNFSNRISDHHIKTHADRNCSMSPG